MTTPPAAYEEPMSAIRSEKEERVEAAQEGRTAASSGRLAASRRLVKAADEESKRLTLLATGESTIFDGSSVKVLDGAGSAVTGAADFTTPGTFDDLRGLLEMLPNKENSGEGLLRQMLQHHCQRHHILEVSAVQKAAIPCVLQGRDVCIVAPTGTGKTLAFAIPTIMAVAQQVARGVNTGAHLEALTKDAMHKGTICKLCELSIAAHPVCPMSGKPHPRPRTSDEQRLHEQQRDEEDDNVTSIKDVRSVAEPFAVIFAPSGVLVSQLYAVLRSISPEQIKVASLWRTSNDDEAKQMLRSLRGCHVLISTPEQVAYAIYKKKLRMSKVRTFVVDEMDTTLDVHHFEAMRIAFSQAPRQVGVRPQRILVGASFPLAVQQAISSGLLHRNRRLVLCNLNARGGETPVTNNTNISHTVLMLSRLEKVDRVSWLYDTGRISPDERCMIFCNSSQTVRTLTEQLRKNVGSAHKVNVMMLHGKLTQEGQRAAIKALQSGACTCLVCSDIGSLGLDINNVSAVVNYDMPSTFSQWVSRVGRCVRRGMQGRSFLRTYG